MHTFMDSKNITLTPLLTVCYIIKGCVIANDDCWRYIYIFFLKYNCVKEGFIWNCSTGHTLASQTALLKRLWIYRCEIYVTQKLQNFSKILRAKLIFCVFVT